MDITPHVDLLGALRQQNLQWKSLISELVDNSFDAGATRVEITYGPGKRLEIRDDGVGCKDISAMLTLGGRRQHSTTKLGRYGIGLKDAALTLWGVTEIETVHRGELRKVRVDWSKVKCADGRWEVPDAETTAANGRVGTVVRFSGFNRGTPNELVLREELGYIFAPAIGSGRQVVVSFGGSRRLACEPYRLPPSTETLEAEFFVDGRGVRMRVGIVADGQPNKHSGFTVTHGHRVIKNSAIGSRGMSMSRIAGILELDDRWTLSKNKDDITELSDELDEAVFERCKQLLRKADEQARILESSALSAAVSSRLTDAISRMAVAHRREKRDRKENGEQGTVEPKGTDKKRRRAAKVYDAIAGAIERAANNGIRCEWNESLDCIGHADIDGNRVQLNSSIPYLKRLRSEENADAITMLAITIYVEALRHFAKAQRFFPEFESDNFIGNLGRVVSGIPEPEPTSKKRSA